MKNIFKIYKKIFANKIHNGVILLTQLNILASLLMDEYILPTRYFIYFLVLYLFGIYMEFTALNYDLYFVPNNHNEIVYLCNTRKCESCSGNCRHTNDVEYAKNFKRIKKENDIYYYIEEE